MRLAVIPARGGSKRIPRKNIRSFAGKPMIGWSIEAALSSRCFNHVIVSTDDKEVADVARTFGADVPFLRPAHLADDHTGTIPVMVHAINWFGRHHGIPEEVCCIYATAPFIQPRDLRYGIELMIESEADYAFSVTSFGFPIQRALRITSDNRVEMFSPEYFESRSQDLEEAYHDAGQFYWGKSEAWLAEKPFFSSCSIPVFLPRHRVQDIDTQEDWLRAELMFEVLRQGTLPDDN